MSERRVLVRLHVNRHEIRKGVDGRPWTIHTSKACIPAREVVIRVPCETEYKPERKHNPKVFLVARARVRALGGARYELV